MAANDAQVKVAPTPSVVSYDSILLHHGTLTPRAFLLLHGLTASPRQFEAFGQMLYERGANVYIPRLPRHGLTDRLTTQLEDLTADELRTFAERSAAYAASLGERLVTVGFSVGGLLSAWIAQHLPIERSVSIAPFLGVAWIPDRFNAHAARLALRAPNHFWWWHPLLREGLMPAHGYPRVATHAIAHAAALGAELLEDAGRDAPAARDIHVVLNARESTVNNSRARRLARRWAGHRASGVGLHRIRGLPASHDIIEPLRLKGVVQHVYPALLDLVDR